MEPACILSQEKGSYRIITEKGEKSAEVSGKFRFKTIAFSEYPAVGDFVMVNWTESGNSAIMEALLPRRSAFIRKAAGDMQQCTHTNEPGCAIQKALETGELQIDRWQSYQKLKAENDLMEDKETYMIAKGKREKEIAKLIKKMPIKR